jgi:hypothetical protein
VDFANSPEGKVYLEIDMNKELILYCKKEIEDYLNKNRQREQNNE